MGNPQGTRTSASSSPSRERPGVLRPATEPTTGQAALAALQAAVDDTLEAKDLAAPMTRLFDGLVAAGWTGEHAAIAAGVAVVTARVTASLVVPEDR